jgi:hypothetical protein
MFDRDRDYKGRTGGNAFIEWGALTGKQRTNEEMTEQLLFQISNIFIIFNITSKSAP